MIDVATIPLDTISSLVIGPAGDFAAIMGQLVLLFFSYIHADQFDWDCLPLLWVSEGGFFPVS